VLNFPVEWAARVRGIGIKHHPLARQQATCLQRLGSGLMGIEGAMVARLCPKRRPSAVNLLRAARGKQTPFANGCAYRAAN